MGPTFNKIKNKKKHKNLKPFGFISRDGEGVFYFFIFIFSRFSLRYTKIGPSEFVGARTKMLYSTRATRGNQKHGISPSFQLKNLKNPIFGFSQIYGFLTVRIGKSKRSN